MSFGPSVPKATVAFFRKAVGGRGFRNPPIRSSAIGTADVCRRKFLYDERLGIKPRSYESALGRGDVFHKFYAAFLLGKSKADAAAEVRKSVEETKSALIAAAGRDGLLANGQDVRSACETADQDYLVGQAMALSAWQLYPVDWSRWELVTDSAGRPMVEYPFEIQVDGLVQPLVGEIDCVLLDKRDGRSVWIWDHKTTSLSPVRRAASASFSMQSAIYHTGLESLLWNRPSLDVVGCVHNIVRTPSIKYCGKDPTFESYVERVGNWYVEEASAKPQDPPIVQSWTRFSSKPDLSVPARLREQDKLSRCSPNPDKFPRNEKSCFAYNRTCPYLDLCTSDPSQWPNLVQLKFDVKFRTNPNKEAE